MGLWCVAPRGRTHPTRLILDCCDAGQSVFNWAPETDDRFRVLTATDRTTRSKEIDELKAGVFTWHLHRALTDPELWMADGTGLLDNDGVIRVNNLHAWLEREVLAYGVQKKRQGMPIPELYGAHSKNIRLTDILPVQRYTFLSPERIAIAGLKNLLLQSGVAIKTAGDIFWTLDKLVQTNGNIQTALSCSCSYS